MTHPGFSSFIQVVICAFLAIAVAQVVAIVQFQNFLFTTNEVSRAFTIAGENYTPYISAILLVIVMEVPFPLDYEQYLPL